MQTVLGPHGPPHRNIRGSNLIDLYLSHDLRVENTFFTSPTYTTFTNIKDNESSMIDIFACSKNLHCRICHCQAVFNGVESDHTAVQLDLVLTSLKRTTSHALTCGSTDWRKIATDPTTKQYYNTLLLAATRENTEMPYTLFNDAIKKAGEKAATLVKSQQADWF